MGLGDAFNQTLFKTYISGQFIINPPLQFIPIRKDNYIASIKLWLFDLKFSL